MKLFDSHCHLDDAVFEPDRESVIQRAIQNDVHQLLTVGTDKETSLQALKIACRHAGCYAAVGVHPHTAASCSNEVILFLKDLVLKDSAKDNKIRAWGETGLDFNRMYSPQADQEKWFIQQIHAADELRLPLIFHERDSKGRFLDILHSHPHPQRKGVVHCFSGNKAALRAYLELDLYIGITGILTLKERGAGLRKLVPDIPVERLLIETDAPYLTPAPQKNKSRRNEPAFVKSVLFKLADVRKEDPEVLAQATWDNARRLFNT